MTTTDQVFRNMLANEVKYTRESLAKMAEQIAENMTRLAEQLRSDQYVLVSDFGELQGANVFNTTCARYAHARQVLKDFDGFYANDSDDQV